MAKTLREEYSEATRRALETDEFKAKQRKTLTDLVKSFERLFGRARSPEETQYLKNVAERLIERMQALTE